jgi:hypothetical protein
MACNKCTQTTPQHTGCGCEETTIVTHICNECPPETPCNCPVKDLSSDCVLYTGNDAKCGDTIVIPKNTILTIALKNIIDFFCQKLQEISNRFRIVNIGNGIGVYKGTNLLGEKELKTLISTDNSVTITTTESTINFSVDIPEIEDEVVTIQNVGDGIGVFRNTTDGLPNLTFHNFKTLSSEDDSIEITFDEDNVFLKVNEDIFPNPTQQTFLGNTPTNTVTGTGTSSDPYLVNAVNLQKVVATYPYTISPNDDKHTIFLDALSADNPNSVVIPHNLPANFTCFFIQKSTGVVQFNSSGGAILNKPNQYSLTMGELGENYGVWLEKELNTVNYYLGGGLDLMP